MKTRWTSTARCIAAAALALLLAAGCGSGSTMKKGTGSEIDSDPPQAAPVVTGAVPDDSDSRTLPVAYELIDIHFDFDRYSLRTADRQILTEHAKWLEQNPGTRVLIEGHCDERGTVEYNLALGEKRANAARNFLTNYGISGGRLEVISYGKERPLDPRHNEQAWAKNRRATFVKR